MTWMILGHGLRGLNAINNIGLLMTYRLWVVCLGHYMLWTTQGYGWYVPFWVMSSRLWMLWTTKHCEWYKWLDIPWAKAFRCFKQLRAMDDMNDSASWAKDGGWHEWLWVMHSQLKILWTTQGCGWHEWLRVMSSRLWMLWVVQSCS